MVRHRTIHQRRYAHYYHSVNMYTLLCAAMIVAIGFGNSGSVTMHTVETKNLKQLQIERSLERHRVGR